jgi:hypothetical protein
VYGLLLAAYAAWVRRFELNGVALYTGSERQKQAAGRLGRDAVFCTVSTGVRCRATASVECKGNSSIGRVYGLESASLANVTLR